METAKQVLDKDLRLLANQLETLRDEIRLQIHLASLDTRDAWRKLEPDLTRAVALANETSKATRGAIDDVLARGRKLAHTLREEAQKSAKH